MKINENQQISKAKSIRAAVARESAISLKFGQRLEGDRGVGELPGGESG